jgi:hypothetical protein
METILDSMNAMDIVSGVELMPPAGQTLIARNLLADFKQRAASARSAIRFSCSESIHSYLDGLRDPKVMWDTLKDRFDTTSTYIGRAAISLKFQTARPAPSETIMQYLNRLQSFRYQLSNSPQAISDEMFKNHVYTTVPATYKNTVEILQRSRVVATVEEVITALRECEETQIATQEAAVQHISDPSTAATSGSALYTTGTQRGGGSRGGRGRSSGRGRGHGRGRGKINREDKSWNCINCQMDNHTTDECRRSQAGTKRKHSEVDQDDSNIKCFHCGRKGHRVKDCHTKKQGEEAKANYNSERKKGRASAKLADGTAAELM